MSIKLKTQRIDLKHICVIIERTAKGFYLGDLLLYYNRRIEIKEKVLNIGKRVRLLPEGKIAEIYRFEKRGDHFVIGLIFEDTHRATTLVFTPDELQKRIVLLPSLRQMFSLTEGVLPHEQFLSFADALRIHLAYTFDPHYAVSVTQVDLSPHQVDAVYYHILLQPRIRFLLADDPGLGKTIMAGLVLKELKARGLVNTVLIVVPAHLQDQWLREMREWFREDLTPLNRSVLQNVLADDFFSRNPHIITSMDFARQEWVRDILRRHHWDMVIVDEAHKFSATRYGNKVYKTKRYQLGEVLADKCNHLLFLTATPHRGDDEAYFLLLDLLYPRMFAQSKHLKQASRKTNLPFILRRCKEQMKDLQGRPLFKRREVKTVSVSLTQSERVLYDAVTAYVRRWYRVVSGRKDRRSRNVALALTVLQRRLSSSLFAVRESLRRRRAKLERLLQEWVRWLDEEKALPLLDEESWQDLMEQTSADWENFQEKLEGMTAAQTPKELKEEINELNKLIELALQAEKAGEEAKVNELRKVVEEHLRHHPEEKLIVFTEFKDTLFALQRKFEKEWGFQVAMIHGGMNLQARLDQERYFRDRVQVLIGTDAAGEGINLQFCRLMVNFDLPWNPNKLEQRMGRIYRYGQKRDCFVFNMLYPETREGRVLERLLKKLELMRKRLGDSVYDVIGQILEGVRLEELIMQAILREDTSRLEHIIDVDVEKRLEEYRRAIEESALAGHHIDLLSVLFDDRDSRKKRLVPWDIERFTKFVVPLVGGECQPDPRKSGVFRIQLPRIFLQQYNLPHEAFCRGVRIAFDRKVARDAGAEFFAPGHPVLDALCKHYLNKSRPVKSILVHPKIEGVLWVFRAGICDGRQSPVLERLLALLWDTDKKEVREVDIRMLWETTPYPEDIPAPENLLEALEESENHVRQWVITRMEDFQKEAKERREREARIKKEWLEKSFNYLIAESNTRLFEYHRRAEKGEDMRLAIQREEENLKRLIKEKKERLEALEQERTLSVLEPQLETVALICRDVKATTTTTDTTQIETIGMEIAMRYEREHGRKPVDVSKEFVGYDILSEGEGEVRHIEVKTFATTGKIYFTPHEWQMAQRLGDEYWLYVVENVSDEPKLQCIQNPAQNLTVREVMGVVKYIVESIK